MKIIITPAGELDANKISNIVSTSNKNVANKFNLTFQNNPKHPSFYTKEWVLKDMKRGEEYFVFIQDNIEVGCVAFEQSTDEKAYLNRLSVLPQFRKKGIGEQLVKYIVNYSKSKDIKKLSIGIISKHTELKNWYLKLGFLEGQTKKFDHLPFNVTYMSFNIKEEK